MSIIFKKNIYGDVNNYKILKKELIKVKPEILFHLAAQPLVSESYINPLNTLKTNIIGTSNLLNILLNIKSLRSIVVITQIKYTKLKIIKAIMKMIYWVEKIHIVYLKFVQN